MLSAEIIAIGSELLTPRFKDTNSLYLTEQLNAIGIPVVMKTIVGDDENYLEDAVRNALARTPVLITIGGLGPTEDDVTRKVVARVLQRQLVLDDEILAKLQRRFKARGVEMPANNARQALVLTGSDILENHHGTAPGLWIAAETNHVILLPGPPSELKPMFERFCMPRLQEMAGGATLARCVFRTACLPESTLDARIAPIYTKYKNPETTILAKPGQVEIRLTARGKNREEAERFRAQALDWELHDDAHRIERTFRFRNFREAGAFVQEIGELAEAEGHHPDLCLSWGRVDATLYTHKINGLTESDFVMAAKIDRALVAK